MLRMNGTQVENDITDEAKQLLDYFWWNYNYKGTFGNPEVSTLSASTFLNYVVDNFSAKVEAHKGSKNATEFHKNIKHIFFSAHDTTTAAFLSALGQQHTQTGNPPLASMTLIELFKRGNEYFMSWRTDDQYIHLTED